MEEMEGVDFSEDLLVAGDIWKTPVKNVLEVDHLGAETGGGKGSVLQVDLEGCPGWVDGEVNGVGLSGRQDPLLGGGCAVSRQKVFVGRPLGGSFGSREKGSPGPSVSPSAGKKSTEEKLGNNSPEVSLGKEKSQARAPEDKRAQTRRKKNWIKTKKAGSSYIFGLDIGWEEVLEMSKLTLVGRVLGRRFVIKTAIDWVEMNWLPLLGYVPEVVTLKGGWFAFKFRLEEHLAQVMKRNWNIFNLPLLLKPWHPLFDANSERVDSVPLWVRLPGLPLQYWKPHHLREIGNIIGNFLEADLSFLENKQREVARILVNVNIREGLAEDLQMIWGPFVYKQVLDYENVPFRCRRCHAYGHPAAECIQPLRTGSKFKKKQPFGKAVEEKDDNGMSAEAQPETRSAPACNPLEVNSEGGDPQLPCKVNQVVVPNMPGGMPSSSRTPGTSFSPLALNPSLNLFFSSVSIDGLDLAISLRNFMISLGPLSHQPPLSLLPDNILEKAPDIPEVNLLSDVSLDLASSSPVPFSSELELGLSSVEGSDSGYFLRSCRKPTSGGLGKGSEPSRPGRGRKSLLSKAQTKAKMDLVSGKQLSIEGALRAVKAQERVPK